MSTPTDFTLFSGGANGAESFFGEMAEKYGVQEVNFTFEGHKSQRSRGLRYLTPEDLSRKDVSLAYVSRLLKRSFTNAPFMRKVLQTIMYQVDSGLEIFVVGTIEDDGTVKGGTGWGAEFAKICNKPLYVFGQKRNAWHKWDDNTGGWVEVKDPVVSQKHFTGTGTRFLEDNGRKAIEELFARSFQGA